MQKFKFRLESLHRFRQRQVEAEEIKLGQIVAERERVRLTIVELENEQNAADKTVGKVFLATELANISNYRAYARKELQRRAAKLAETDQQVAAQRQVVIDARRQVELIETLKEKQLKEWQKAADKEIEELGQESYLARFSRQMREA